MGPRRRGLRRGVWRRGLPAWRLRRRGLPAWRLRRRGLPALASPAAGAAGVASLGCSGDTGTVWGLPGPSAASWADASRRATGPRAGEPVRLVRRYGRPGTTAIGRRHARPSRITGCWSVRCGAADPDGLVGSGSCAWDVPGMRRTTADEECCLPRSDPSDLLDITGVNEGRNRGSPIETRGRLWGTLPCNARHVAVGTSTSAGRWATRTTSARAAAISGGRAAAGPEVEAGGELTVTSGPGQRRTRRTGYLRSRSQDPGPRPRRQRLAVALRCDDLRPRSRRRPIRRPRHSWRRLHRLAHSPAVPRVHPPASETSPSSMRGHGLDRRAATPTPTRRPVRVVGACHGMDAQRVRPGVSHDRTGLRRSSPSAREAWRGACLASRSGGTTLDSQGGARRACWRP